MSIETDFKKLKDSRLPFLWGKCHEALIGLWIDWWFSLKEKRLVNNGGRKIKDSKGNYRTADIFLCKLKNGRKYAIEGIAEVENTKPKWYEKLKTLEEYTKVKVGKNLKFPSLEFILLSIVYDENPNSSKKLYNKLIEEAKKVSRKIKQKVIIAKFIKSNIAESRKEVYATIDMAGVGGDKQKDFFIWKPFTGEIEIIIYNNGNEKIIKVGKKLVGKNKKQKGL
ncbi:hypothetical protein HZA98_05030 [Candidatus Woesearchaeota archaeon]|nr:hypothetical protein [Candidatus Woesearchaeota archaeon]